MTAEEKLKERVVLGKPYRLNPVVMRWVESLASCAIEGNELGVEMLDYWNNGNEDKFVKMLEGIFQADLLAEYREDRPKGANNGRMARTSTHC